MTDTPRTTAPAMEGDRKEDAVPDNNPLNLDCWIEGDEIVTASGGRIPLHKWYPVAMRQETLPAPATEGDLARQLYDAYVSHHPEAYWSWDELAPTQYRQWNDVARAATAALSMPDGGALVPHFGPEYYESEDDE